MTVGLLYGHKCKVCKRRQPNNRMRPAGARWICLDCQAEQQAAKASGKG